jgi:hypothetical protein
LHGGDNMTRRVKRSWIVLGLGVLLWIAGDGCESQAASAIGIKGGYKPGKGDPPIDFLFQAYLEPPSNVGESNTLQSGDSFTINALPGVTSASTNSVDVPPHLPVPNYSWSNASFAAVTNPYLSPPYTDPTFAANVTWTYTGTDTVVATTSPVYLGQFAVQSTFNFAAGQLPMPDGTTVTYSFTFDGQGASGSDSFAIQNLSVPEPSSVFLLAASAVTLPVWWLGERRRRVRIYGRSS